MLIKRIKLSNFRQFKDEHVIEFSTDKEKNVSVVLGSNTCGKTTIVGAFIWCLYGENTLKEPKMLLNNIVANSMGSVGTKEVSVEVTLRHENNEYIIFRRQLWQKTGIGDGFRAGAQELRVSYIDERGETNAVPYNDCQDQINRILPQDLADYFFFDGERIKKINNKNNVVNAVRGLMGLDVYTAGRDHLDPSSNRSVIGKFKKELDPGKDSDAEKRKWEIEKYKDELANFQKETPNIEEQIAFYKDQLAEFAQKIKENEDVKKLQEYKEKLERDVRHFDEAITKSEERFVKDFNNNAAYFFALPLIKNGLNILSNANEEGAGIPDMHATSIDYIIERGKCICGQELTKNQGAVDHLRCEQRLLPPEHIGTAVRTFKNDMHNATTNVSLYVDNIKGDYESWLDNQNELDEKNRELKEISEKIKGSVDVRRFEEKYQESANQLARFERAKEGNRDKIVELKTRINENEKDIDRLFASTDKNRKILLYIDYATALYNWVNNFYQEQEECIKKELLDSINKNFSQMYHGSRTVIMDNNYKIKPVTIGDQVELAKSEGLETVTNFSFIMGLVELARARANNSDESDAENQKLTEPYPIVMDAPFSNTDAVHIQNITSRLPHVAEQVIIFIMDKDWEHAQKELNNYLGSKYVIEKVNNRDDHSVLRREI